MSDQRMPPEGSDAERARSVRQALIEHRSMLDAAVGALSENVDPIALLADRLVAALFSGGKIMVAGNGGSAAEAQHFAAELVGRFRHERRALPALALTTDSSILTAIGNDYSFEEVFSRQVEALGKQGDVFLGYSTSGESSNLIRAARAARDLGIETAAVTGPEPSSLGREVSIAIRLPAEDTATVQEMQMMLTHLLCGILEDAFVPSVGDTDSRSEARE